MNQANIIVHALLDIPSEAKFSFAPFAIICALLLYIIYRFITIFFGNQDILRAGGQRFKILPDDPILLETLNASLPYFLNLSPQAKTVFINRLVRFMRSTYFVAVQPLELSPQMAIRISATFIQITFGMRKNVLDFYVLIKIHKEHYFNERNKRFFKGEVNLSGIIQLSWEDFEKGYAIGDDCYNVGIHEMAHALAMELLDERNTYPEIVRHMRPLYMLAREEIINPSMRSHILREYAYTNIQEYLAVTTEVFFEAPEKMKQGHPQLFELLKELYLQNPLNPDNASMQIGQRDK